MYHKCRVSRLQYTTLIPLLTTLLYTSCYVPYFWPSQYPPIQCVCVGGGSMNLLVFVTTVQRIGTCTEIIFKKTQWRIQDFPGGGGVVGGFACFFDKRAKDWNLDGNIIQRNPVADPGFSLEVHHPLGGREPTPKLGVLTYCLANFLSKTAWKWKNLDPGGGGVCPWRRPLDPPMKSILHCLSNGIRSD